MGRWLLRQIIMYVLLAQAVGLLAIALGTLSFQCRRTGTLLLCQTLGNVAFVVHYGMLGAYSACLGQMVLIVSNLFLCGEKTSRCAVLKWGCAAAALGASFTAWKDGFSVLPGAAAVVTVLTNWTFRGEVIRLGKLLVSCPLWVVYDVHVGSWSGILCELIAMGSATVSIRRYGSQASTNSSRKRRPSA